MAKTTTTKCIVCGALVGPGVQFCSRFCKITKVNDDRLKALKAKSDKKATKKKTTAKKDKE